MKPLSLAIALAGLTAVSATLIIWGGEAGNRQPPQDAAIAEADEQASVPAAAVVEPIRAPRAVAPRTFSAPVADTSQLQRVEPRPPLSNIGEALKPSQQPPEARPLHRPVADAAGRFVAQGYIVELAGLVPTALVASCGEGSEVWPCGVHARTAFRNLLRGRAPTCVVPPAPPAEVLVLECRLGRLDVAAWLVEHGWARAIRGGPYADLEAEAKHERRGIFGHGPIHIALPAD